MRTTKEVFIVEKNELINMDREPNVGGKRMAVPSFQQTTINQLVENTKNYMGSRFVPYSALSNNCQHFVKAVLLSNGVDDPSV